MSKVFDFTEKIAKRKELHFYLACSGGVDSMVLLFLMQKTAVNYTVIHVNYHLRGTDSDGDEEFIRNYCTDNNISFLSRSFDTPSLLKNGGNLQEIARELRYSWFHELLNNDPSHRIVLAHHRDDQVETFFQHLARKSGIMGLAGMLPEHQGIIRPLLCFSKNEILHFANINSISWREDSSNAQSKYSRNKLRNIILPSLLQEVPSLFTSVTDLISAFQQTQAYIEEIITPIVSFIRFSQYCDIATWKQLDEDLQAEVLRQLGIRPSAIGEINKMKNSQKGKKVCIDQWIITTGDRKLYFEKQYAETSGYLPPVLQIEHVSELPSSFSPSVIYLDHRKITGELSVRKWKEGDKMQVIGMKGSKLISKILTEAKIPSSQKENSYILEDEQHILWCIGFKVSPVASAQDQVDEIVKISIQSRHKNTN